MKVSKLLGLATTLRELSIPITGISLPQDEWDELIKDIKTGHPAIYKKLNHTSIKMGGLHCELRRDDKEVELNALLDRVFTSHNKRKSGKPHESITSILMERKDRY